ncbi:hypothetical protein ECB98_20615 [Brucellaceae bacterium VT-16-1752]|nr:hypothetical protein ECB98_20615 [Brucellaceae bacterium VT-16-1752]
MPRLLRRLGKHHGLRLPVLAEGIETQGELKFLAVELCKEGQGYYVRRRAPIEHSRAWCARLAKRVPWLRPGKPRQLGSPAFGGQWGRNGLEILILLLRKSRFENSRAQPILLK